MPISHDRMAFHITVYHARTWLSTLFYLAGASQIIGKHREDTAPWFVPTFPKIWGAPLFGSGLVRSSLTGSAAVTRLGNRGYSKPLRRRDFQSRALLKLLLRDFAPTVLFGLADLTEFRMWGILRNVRRGKFCSGTNAPSRFVKSWAVFCWMLIANPAL